jgi:hypothetical protein
MAVLAALAMMETGENFEVVGFCGFAKPRT